VNKSDASYCPKLIGFTMYDEHGHVIHQGRHKFSFSKGKPRVRSSFFLCVMKGNRSHVVRSIKINIFGCVDGGCDCIVRGIIARKALMNDMINPSQVTDDYISGAIREVFAGNKDCELMLHKVLAHIELFTNPSIASRGITPVKSETVESAHPASLQGGAFTHTIIFPGASKLTVTFDKRSGKGSGHSGISMMKVKCAFFI
jgi:hypothetical protein